MKARINLGCFSALACLCLLLPPVVARAKPPVLHYQFVTGVTNVYSVEEVVQGENGQDITSGNVFITATEVSSNLATLTWRASLHTETRNADQPGAGFYGYRNMPNYMPRYPGNSQLNLDDHGHVLRSTGDDALTVPLGELVQSIYEPLPARPAAMDKIEDEVQVLDAPKLQGPVTSPVSSQPGFGFMGYNPRSLPVALTLARQTVWQIVSNTPNRLTLKKQTSLQSYLQTGGEPRLRATATALLEFNLRDGVFENIEVSAALSSVTEQTSRQSKIHYTCRLLTGTALAAALAPVAPPAPARLSEVDLQSVITDLKSEDASTRRQALMRLNGVTVDAPSSELMDLLVPLLTDSDQFTRMTAVNVFAPRATRENVPLLLKLLKDPDFSIRQTTIKALVRLHDERAIEPLVDLVARGGSFNQDAANALGSQGPSAEKAVLTLLNERSTDVRRQACVILKQIGTRDSLEPLQKQTGDPDQSLSQAAVEALQAINARQ